jgi:hypothetical protein
VLAGGVPGGRYVASSMHSELPGRAWIVAAWTAVTALSLVLVAVTGLLAAGLRRMPSLDPVRR